nr:reverse transcriptase domain-containing protein [Tanacetum cinerariifolium]
MVRSWQRTVKQKITQSFEQGKEIKFPPLANSHGTEGPLVIEAEVGGHTIHRMYIDGGSSMKILYEHCFNRLRPDIKRQMVPATTSLIGFSGETTWPLGQLKLLVTIGDATHSTKAWMNFMIVKSLSPYNGIIGRPGLKAIQAVPSTVHGMLKFPTEERIVTIRSSLLIPAECASVDTSSVTPGEKKARPANLTVPLHPNFPDQVVVGGSLSDKRRTELCSLLKKNLDIFAWQPSDMTGVPRSVAEHRLNVREGCPPVRQKKRGQAPERTKDCYPLPEIDWKVKSLCGYPFKCFLDAYKGYHQIQMAAADEEKPAFHTGQGVYCYTKMPFGLKNAGATYQRLMDKAFENQMGRNIEVYVDDFVVKSHTEEEMVRDIEETPRTSIKGQILADFLNEIPSNASQGMPVAETQEEPWMLFTDGSSCVDGSGAGLILTNPDGVEFTYALRFQFVTSNNKAEYEALIVGLRIAKQMGVKNIQANVDSKLVANQVLGTYVAKEDNMIKYLDIAKGLVSGFKTFSISQVPRRKEITAVIEEEGPTWMTELVNYLKEGTLPEDEKKARKLRLKARQYELMEEILYKQSFLTPWLRCVGPLQAEYVMKEIHEGSCPFPEGPGKVKFLIVAMYYFTKWIEAKAVATITGGQVTKFVWDNIVCRFGIPGEIISDNGKQFANNSFKDWCDKLNITQHFASVKHPQSNRLVERANRSLWEVIPAEIGMPTYRTTTVDVVNNDEELRLNLDLLEERRELAAMNEARSKSKMMKYYNSQIRGVAFKPGDFVYRSNDASHAVAGGKLGPKWEGPYEVTDALGNGAYKLRSMDGMMLPRTWNVTNLKRCYL